MFGAYSAWAFGTVSAMGRALPLGAAGALTLPTPQLPHTPSDGRRWPPASQAPLLCCACTGAPRGSRRARGCFGAPEPPEGKAVTGAGRQVLRGLSPAPAPHQPAHRTADRSPAVTTTCATVSSILVWACLASGRVRGHHQRASSRWDPTCRAAGAGALPPSVPRGVTLVPPAVPCVFTGLGAAALRQRLPSGNEPHPIPLQALLRTLAAAAAPIRRGECG